MAEQIKLVAQKRTELGKGPTGRLRKQGRTPGIVYGRELEPQAVSVDALELYHATHTSQGMNALVRLDIEGDEVLSVFKDPQRHPVRGDITHIDFYAVSKGVQINVEIPVHLTGQDDVQDGAIVTLVLNTIPRKVLPLSIPEYVELDVAGLEIGDVRRAGDIALPEGTALDIDENRTVVTINAPTVAAVDDEDADGEGDEPGDGPADPAEVPADAE